jgi:putative restriction endonuclease
MARNLWTENEVLAALELYLRTPFGRIHHRNPEIIGLAETLGRTPGSIALKLANFANLDDSLPRRGMANASSLDRKVWNDFFHSLSVAGPELGLQSTSSSLSAQDNKQSDYEYEELIGQEAIRLGKIRLNQRLFRKMVLSSYDFRCAVSGISQPELLIAGHIKPWAEDPQNRLNPTNGICLNRLHDAAFEEGLITFDGDGSILYSRKLDHVSKDKLVAISVSDKLRLPRKFRPNPAFLDYHRRHRFLH